MRVEPHHRAAFRDRGLLHLERLVPQARVRAARDALLAELTRLGFREGGRWQTRRLGDLPPFQASVAVSRGVRHQPAFDALLPDALVPFLAELAGAPLPTGTGPPQVLVTPPQRLPWTVPHLGWHVDLAAPRRGEVGGVQVFVVLDDLPPQGGATLALAGSHRLHGLDGSASAHQVLRADPATSGLLAADDPDRDRFLRPHVVRGVPVQVVELCGRAGDAWVMDMAVLHAPAVAATRQARMVLTWRWMRER